MIGFALFGVFISIMFGVLVVGVISAFGGMTSLIIGRFSGLAYIGKVSYSFYLYHIPVILAMKPVVASYVVGFFSQFVLVLVCVLLMASASFHVVEARWHSVK